eukprot:scaffold47624_cov60-Phaeocystis_antarctica.AAC.1
MCAHICADFTLGLREAGPTSYANALFADHDRAARGERWPLLALPPALPLPCANFAQVIFTTFASSGRHAHQLAIRLQLRRGMRERVEAILPQGHQDQLAIRLQL